jgi:hypothetical protein
MALQFFSENQGQKAAKYMAPGYFIPLMKNGAYSQYTCWDNKEIESTRLRRDAAETKRKFLRAFF